MKQYVIGLDYGSLSVRALMIDIHTGEEVAECVYEYPHGCLDEALPSGKKLPPQFALQVPADYREGLIRTVRGVMEQAGVPKEAVIGIGIDATGSTILPAKRDKTPLCEVPAFVDDPHAYIKMWKHHGGEAEAAQIQQVIEDRGEMFLSYYGGSVSSEWMFPKILETYHKAPEVYAAADLFIDVADWIVWLLTDELSRNSCIYGYKAFYRRDQVTEENTGFPSREFFKALDPGFENVVEEKLFGPILSVGDRAGSLCPEMAEELGLEPGIAIAAALLDAHASVAGSGVTEPGEMVIVMGTSSCHMLLTEVGKGMDGVSGVVYDGIIKGTYGCESGQSCVGDGFGWFVDHFVPADYAEEARQRGMDVHQLLAEKLAGYRAGSSGLLALDWLNGVRTPLADFDLSGMILGLTLATRPEEMYMALMEATAYGTRWILDKYEEAGAKVDSVVLCGGIPRKNELLVQVYADVLNRTVRVAGSKQTVALGACFQAISAAGPEVTGYASIKEAARALTIAGEKIYQPRPESVGIYEKLYREYRTLADYFGTGVNDVMKRVRKLM